MAREWPPQLWIAWKAERKYLEKFQIWRIHCKFICLYNHEKKLHRKKPPPMLGFYSVGGCFPTGLVQTIL